MIARKQSFRQFFIRIVLPSVLTIVMFYVMFYVVIIPEYERTIMDRKREMIRELTNSAWSVLTSYYKAECDSLMSREKAQKEAVLVIQNLRYGDKNKDYFWITDMRPYMVAHPYRKDLNGTDLTNFKDPNGKRLFVEFVDSVKASGEGFVDYMWQWKDDSTRIVPKLSYVRGFRPWGWIIGTGIYIEDVKAQIAQMEKRIINVSLIIILIIAILLAIILRQSLKIESKRHKAEADLKEAKERYKALVEASTEGSLMLLEGLTYANNTMLDLLGYHETEISTAKFGDLINEKRFSDKAISFNDLYTLFDTPKQFESQLKRRDGTLMDVLLNVSSISIAGRNAIIVISKELERKQDKEIQDEDRSQFSNLADQFSIGVFRTTLDRKSMFVQANLSAVKIFGGSNASDLLGSNIEELFSDVYERRHLVRELMRKGEVHHRELKIMRNDRTSGYIRVSLKMLNDGNRDVRYCEGIVEDITLLKEADLAHEQFVDELQKSRTWMEVPVSESIHPAVSCGMKVSIKRACSLINPVNGNVLFIEGQEGEVLGMLTADEVRKCLCDRSFDPERPVFEFMRAPLHALPETTPLSEAILFMEENKMDNLPVKDGSGKITGVFTSNDFVTRLNYNAEFLLRKIERAETAGALRAVQLNLRQVVSNSVKTGLGPENITRMIGTVSESIVRKLNAMALQEIGQPPVPYAFITMGSVGRSEQTLATDQDNAIVYEDVANDKTAEVQQYFLKIAKRICTGLDEIGYSYCKGGIMAQNPKFCQPLSVWKKYFSDWVATVDPQDLLDVNVFFDFRFSFGQASLSDQLREYLNGILDQKNMFFYHLASNTLSIKPPINIFGNIIKSGKEEHHEAFDIKKAIMPVVGFARVYALKNNVSENNTLARLDALYALNIITKPEFDQIVQMYNYLMNLRFRHQVEQLKRRTNPDNYINPDMLTELDQTIVKKIFSMTNIIQTKLSYDFKGTAN